MSKHFVVVARITSSERHGDRLGQIARAALVDLGEVSNCTVLRETRNEATLSFETEYADWPDGLSALCRHHGLSVAPESVVMQRHTVTLRNDSDRTPGEVSLGKLAVAALGELAGVIDIKIEFETLFAVRASFVWISHGTPVIPEEHLHRFGIERSA